MERGHVDLGPRLIDGRWTLLGRDDTQSPPVWRSPDDLVLRVNDSARMAVPDEKQYEFLGLGGKPAWVVPQTQDQKVVWLGWNTQAPEVVAPSPRGVDLVVTGHRGPGTVHLFLQNGFESPLPLYDSRRPERQSIHMEPNTHVHANWVFSQPGVHLVDVEVRGTDTQGVLHSTYTTVRFAVGDAASADRARAARSAGHGEGSASPTASSSGSSSASTEAGSPPQRPAAGQPSSGSGRWVVAAAIGLGAVVVGLVVAALRRRRVRRAVWGKTDGEEDQR